jgi:predicted PurR-regulated permease PerM
VNKVHALAGGQVKDASDKGTDEQPPLIRRAEVVAIALVGLLVIAVAAVLYVGKAFFLPVTTAFVIGTMFAPAAGFLAKRGVPRALAAVMIVLVSFGSLTAVIGMIAAPVIAWLNRLPELAMSLKAKLQAFDRITGVWKQLHGVLGSDTGTESQVQLPKIDWVQSTLEFLSPTFTEILLFLVTLVLFIASWPSLRRSLVMTFSQHDGRLRALKILNEIETSLGGYLLMVTIINMCVGIATGLICWSASMPNPVGLGALAATLNFFPIIGPIAMFAVLVAVGAVSFETLSAGMLGPAGFVAMTFIEGHFITPAIIGRRLELNALAVFVALAFWTWLWGPMGGFLAGPLLIVALVLREHLVPSDEPRLPT